MRHVEVGENELISGIDLVGLLHLLQGLFTTHEEVYAVLDVDAAVEQDRPHHSQAELLVIYHHYTVVEILLEFVKFVDYGFPFLNLFKFINLQARPFFGNNLLVGVLTFPVGLLVVVFGADWNLVEHKRERENGPAVLFRFEDDVAVEFFGDHSAYYQA